MDIYFSTFVTGTSEIVREAIKKKPLKRFKILRLLDGLVIFKTAYSLRDIRSVRYFNNSFILFKFFKKVGSDPINQMIRESLMDSKLKMIVPPNTRQKIKTFKLVTSLENRTVSADRSLLKKLEDKISKDTELKLNIIKPDIEFWFLARREGIGLFGLRITYKDRYLEKGELRPELAHILCLISEPSPKDTFLDPFAGSGAAPLERAVSFPYREIIAVDGKGSLVNELKKKAKREMPKKKILVKQGNALNLSDIRDVSIDKIVTDPPWGMYEEVKIPLSEFYSKMLKEFSRVLKPSGIAVILIGDKLEFEKSLEQEESFGVLSRYDILVSGNKARIYKIKKHNS